MNVQPEPAQPLTTSPKPLAPSIHHRVEPGETLWRLGQRYKISIEEIRQANGLTSDTIRIGQILIIPASEVASSELQVASPTPPSTPQPSTVPNSSPSPLAPSPAASPQLVTRPSSPVTELRQKFLTSTRQLAAQKIGYNDNWHPPGSRESWVMDCSNTTRYLYRQVAQIDIGRTASDQYYFLRQKQQAWIIPLDAQGKPDHAILEKYLQPGDLLFWENTYKPVRNIPITHVAVYLGKNREGQMIMAASQQASEGENRNPNGGPDIYPFYPSRQPGGYRGWFGGWTARGQLVAFGRPLLDFKPKTALNNTQGNSSATQ